MRIIGPIFFGGGNGKKKKNLKKKFTIPPKKNIGPMIRIGREIHCLPYAGFFVILLEKMVNQIFAKTTVS